MKVAENMIIPLQIKKALDGRPQRWLGQQLDLTDDAISRRMNGILNFSETELETVEKLLNFKIKKQVK